MSLFSWSFQIRYSNLFRNSDFWRWLSIFNLRLASSSSRCFKSFLSWNEKKSRHTRTHTLARTQTHIYLSVRISCYQWKHLAPKQLVFAGAVSILRMRTFTLGLPMTAKSKENKNRDLNGNIFGNIPKVIHAHINPSKARVRAHVSSK